MYRQPCIIVGENVGRTEGVVYYEGGPRESWTRDRAEAYIFNDPAAAERKRAILAERWSADVLDIEDLTVASPSQEVEG